MNDSRKTSRDRAMYAIGILPPIALILIFLSAAGKWQVNAAKIRPMLEKTFSSQLIDAPSPAAMEYDQRTSDEKTKAYRELLAGLDALHDKYDVVLEFVDDEANWFDNLDQTRPIDNYLKAYLDEAAPLLKLAREIDTSLTTIWMPHATGNPYNYSSALGANSSLFDLIQSEFCMAVRSRDAARAIDAVGLNRKLDIGALSLTELLPFVAESLTTGIWSEADLDQLDQLIRSAPDLNQAWQLNLKGGVLSQTPWLLEGKGVRSWRPDPIPITYAPSRRIQWLQHDQQFRNVGKIGTLRSFKKVMEIYADQHLESDSELDVAIQTPLYGQFYDGGTNKRYLAELYVRVANDRRFTRTAVALAKYKLKLGSYPERLGELTKVGLPSSVALDLLGDPFHYAADETGCRLANASVYFPERQGSATSLSLQGRQETLGTLLREYRELNFSENAGSLQLGHDRSPPADTSY